ncbi:hypothetical protein Cni_G08187 [Canna indica]|uniref:Phytocyanin domain-containing protein n=1 Tax=Canna indica TaxID=4628 RepID=A0AAQ3Q7P8_9LILI|nr:hypothetical protein Cni_G08187 [Canna indica]
MASKQSLAVALAILAVALPLAMAADIVVGGDNGWMPDFNYTLWAEGQEFIVGDNLIFKYNEGDHNVIPVGGAEFKACRAGGEDKVLSSGNDVLPLKTTGKKWYLCGKGDHCDRGQKLVITVLPDVGLAPSSPPPPPSSSANRVGFLTCWMLLMAIVARIMN